MNLKDIKCVAEQVLIPIMQKIKLSKPGNHIYALNFKSYLRDTKLCAVTRLEIYIVFLQKLKPSDKLFSGFLTNELGVARYELRVTIHCTSYQLLLIARVASSFLRKSYELLFIALVTS